MVASHIFAVYIGSYNSKPALYSGDCQNWIRPFVFELMKVGILAFLDAVVCRKNSICVLCIPAHMFSQKLHFVIKASNLALLWHAT